MPTYTIFQDATGIILWTGEADNELLALDLMALDAGYDNYADLTEVTGPDNGVKIIEGVVE